VEPQSVADALDADALDPSRCTGVVRAADAPDDAAAEGFSQAGSGSVSPLMKVSVVNDSAAAAAFLVLLTAQLFTAVLRRNPRLGGKPLIAWRCLSRQRSGVRVAVGMETRHVERI
jgi:hypothetical protein